MLVIRRMNERGHISCSPADCESKLGELIRRYQVAKGKLPAGQSTLNDALATLHQQLAASTVPAAGPQLVELEDEAGGRRKRHRSDDDDTTTKRPSNCCCTISRKSGQLVVLKRRTSGASGMRPGISYVRP